MRTVLTMAAAVAATAALAACQGEYRYASPESTCVSEGRYSDGSVYCKAHVSGCASGYTSFTNARGRIVCQRRVARTPGPDTDPT